jgi:hypothetical protein
MARVPDGSRGGTGVSRFPGRDARGRVATALQGRVRILLRASDARSPATGSVAGLRCAPERETGLEPATFSLEGNLSGVCCRSPAPEFQQLRQFARAGPSIHLPVTAILLPDLLPGSVRRTGHGTSLGCLTRLGGEAPVASPRCPPRKIRRTFHEEARCLRSSIMTSLYRVPATTAGAARLRVVPSPLWRLLLSPQQYAGPEPSAQV